MKCVIFVSETTNKRVTGILIPSILAFSCKTVQEKLWKSIYICKSYSEEISGTFLCGHGVDDKKRLKQLLQQNDKECSASCLSIVVYVKQKQLTKWTCHVCVNVVLPDTETSDWVTDCSREWNQWQQRKSQVQHRTDTALQWSVQ